MLKKCKANKKKIEKLDADLYGLSQKDIDDNKKQLDKDKKNAGMS